MNQPTFLSGSQEDAGSTKDVSERVSIIESIPSGMLGGMFS